VETMSAWVAMIFANNGCGTPPSVASCAPPWRVAGHLAFSSSVHIGLAAKPLRVDTGGYRTNQESLDVGV
jgi:hypothetical protein